LLLRVFLSFAAANFVSAVLRAVMATLAPTMSRTMGLTAADLGLLAGAHFLGFALAQLPLGAALDRRGPKPVLLALMCLAVLGCLGFSLARDLPELLLARLLIGLGVSGCLMAGLTAFSRMLVPASQLRVNAWMLMSGSLGMLASTLPVQWLLPGLGWRGLFVLFGGLLVLAMAAVAI
jgi:MFS family permease